MNYERVYAEKHKYNTSEKHIFVKQKNKRPCNQSTKTYFYFLLLLF